MNLKMRLIRTHLLCTTQQIEQESRAISQFQDNSKGFLTITTKNRIEKNQPRFFEKSN